MAVDSAFYAAGVVLPGPSAAPGTNGHSPSWNTDGTFAGWVAVGGAPAGTGTELQYRASASALGAITGSSYNGNTLSLSTTGANKYCQTVSSRAGQIQIDYPVTATLAPSGRRNWIQTDKDGAINVLFNCVFNDNNGDTVSGNWTWTVFDATKPLAAIVLDSQGDFNYYYAPAGSTTISIPSIIHMTGVNGASDPQLTISAQASTITHPTAHLLVHNSLPRVLITDNTGISFTDNTTLCELTRSSAAWLRVRRSDNMPSGDSGGGLAAMGSDDAGNSNKQIHIQAGRAAAFSTTLHGLLATNCPGGLIVSADNATPHLTITAAGVTRVVGKLGVGTIPFYGYQVEVYKNQNTSTYLGVINETNGTSALAGLLVGDGSKSFSITYRAANYTDDSTLADCAVLRADASIGGGLKIRTGGTAPIKFGVNDTDILTIANGGNVGISQTTFGTSAANVFAVHNGTAPSTSPADCYQIYSADYSAGNACLHHREEGGAVIKLKQQAKASYNNWAAFTDVVAALVAMGIFDTA